MELEKVSSNQNAAQDLELLSMAMKATYRMIDSKSTIYKLTLQAIDDDCFRNLIASVDMIFDLSRKSNLDLAMQSSLILQNFLFSVGTTRLGGSMLMDGKQKVFFKDHFSLAVVKADHYLLSKGWLINDLKIPDYDGDNFAPLPKAKNATVFVPPSNVYRDFPAILVSASFSRIIYASLALSADFNPKINTFLSGTLSVILQGLENKYPVEDDFSSFAVSLKMSDQPMEISLPMTFSDKPPKILGV